MDNLSLFNYSLVNLEEHFDETYKKGKLFITVDPNEKNSLMVKNEKLIELITAYKVMMDRFIGNQEQEIIDQIDSLLFGGGDQMNYTAFSQYFLVCDTNFNMIQKQKPEERKKNLRYLIQEYIKNRHTIYLKHGYSNIVLQVSKNE